MSKWQLSMGSALALVSGFSGIQTEHAQADDFSLEEIIVQARRRAESVQDFPVSVTAISPKAIEQAFAVDIQDLEGRTPNLIIDTVNAGPRAAAISIRGISFEDIEKSFDPAVGVLIDGVYIGTNTGQLLNPFDFESIEILRGPQGTLFGKNTTAGVISVRRTKPTGELGIRAQAVIGDFGRREAQIVANAPSIGDKFALKGTFYLQEGDGFYNNVTLGQTVGKTDFWHASLTGLFTPTDDISLLVTYDRMRDRGETAQAQLSNGTDLICLGPVLAPGVPALAAGFAPQSECGRDTDDDLYTVFSDRRAPIKDDINAITAELNVALGDFDLTAITGWRDQEEDVQQDFDASASAFFNTRRIQNFSQFSQEIRVSGQLSEKLDGVAGIYFFSSQYDLVQLTQFGAVLGGGAPLALNPTTDHEARSYAGFADLQYQITDVWRVNGGIRWTYEEKEIIRTNAIIIDPAITDINTLPSGPVPDASRLQNGLVSGDESWDELTWRLTTDYKITDDFLAYGSVSRGFRSGGFNGRANTV
ncbi:MAG: TonB-dependent receptor, partial [Pseudomonadota bacterium]